MLIALVASALFFAASPRAPRLGPLVLAAMLPDIAMWLLVLAGVEHVGVSPGLSAMSAFDLWDVRWSHSLLGTLGLAAGFAVAVKLLTRDKDAAWIGAAVVASHWVIDLPFHVPDLTLAGSGVRYGWGWYDRPWLAMPAALLAGFLAFAWFVNHTRPAGRIGRAAPVAFAAVLLGFQFADWFAAQPSAMLPEVPTGVPVRALATVVILTVLAWWTGTSRLRRATPRLRVVETASESGSARRDAR